MLCGLGALIALVRLVHRASSRGERERRFCDESQALLLESPRRQDATVRAEVHDVSSVFTCIEQPELETSDSIGAYGS